MFPNENLNISRAGKLSSSSPMALSQRVLPGAPMTAQFVRPPDHTRWRHNVSAASCGTVIATTAAPLGDASDALTLRSTGARSGESSSGAKHTNPKSSETNGPVSVRAVWGSYRYRCRKRS